MKELRAQGRAWADAQLWIEKWTEGLSRVRATERSIEDSEVSRVLALLSEKLEGRKARNARRTRERRKQRSEEGWCVRCPEGDVKKARPGRKTCEGCVSFARYRNPGRAESAVRWSETDLETHLARRRGEDSETQTSESNAHKFGARRTVGSNGRTYASAFEAKRAEELALAHKLGRVRNLAEQVRYPLTGANGEPYLIRSEGFPGGPKAVFWADFVYEERSENGEWHTVIEDVK